MIKWLFTCSMVIVVTIATLLVLEQGVRYWRPELYPTSQLVLQAGSGKKPTLGRANTKYRHFLPAGDFDVSVRFNKAGFRDDKHPASATADDWFAVGDSIAFGWGVKEEQRVTELLEKELGIAIYNISVPGILEQSELLTKHATKHGAKIDRLLLFFSTEVRIEDWSKYKVIQPPSDSWYQLKAYLSQNFALYHLLTSFIHQHSYLKSAANQAGVVNSPQIKKRSPRRFSQVALDSTIDRLAKYVTRYDTTVVICPARRLWFGLTIADEDRINREFTRRLRKLGVNVINLRRAFERDGNPLDLFFPNDPLHWTPEGHRIAAEAVASGIRGMQ